jgi:hypothetical protein
MQSGSATSTLILGSVALWAIPALNVRVEEEDKVGVMVILEASVAAGAAMAGTPPVAVAAGFLPMIDYYLSQVRGRGDNVNALVEGTVEAVGATPEEFLEWIKADKRHLALFHEAVEGTWSTFEQDRVEALKRVLADGFTDSARIDIDTLVVKALRDLDPPHVQLLAYFGGLGGPATLNGMAAALPELVRALAPLLSVLERHDCASRAQVIKDLSSPYKTTLEWTMTAFGRECLQFLTGVQRPDRL